MNHNYNISLKLTLRNLGVHPAFSAHSHRSEPPRPKSFQKDMPLRLNLDSTRSV